MTQDEQEIFDRLWTLYIERENGLKGKDMINVLLFSACAISVIEEVNISDLMNAILEYKASVTEAYINILERHANGRLNEQEERDLRPILRLVHNQDPIEE